MSTTCPLPSTPSTASSPLRGTLQSLRATLRDAMHAVAALSSTSDADTREVWRLYRHAGETDSVSVKAVAALAERARTR